MDLKTLQNLDEYTDKCNYETMIIPQCETSGCLENIEEIASIDGVDGIFVGPYDLSIALGIPGQFNSDILINALDRIVKACKRQANLPLYLQMIRKAPQRILKWVLIPLQ